MEIYLVRHTTPAVDKGMMYGRTDLRLVDTFEEEAKVVKSQLPSDFDAVYTSPLYRCKTLAAFISKEFIISNEIIEMDFGDWEMKHKKEIPKNGFGASFEEMLVQKTPNGESMGDLFNRVQNFRNELLNSKHQRICVVTHAGPIKAWNGLHDNLSPKKWITFPLDYGAVFKFIH